MQEATQGKRRISLVSSCARGRGSGWICNHCFSERWRDRGDGISLLRASARPHEVSHLLDAETRSILTSPNGTANIGIASPGLVASDQQVWCPSLQHVAGKTPSSPPFREKMNDAPIASSNSYHHIYFGGNTGKLETILGGACLWKGRVPARLITDHCSLITGYEMVGAESSRTSWLHLFESHQKPCRGRLAEDRCRRHARRYVFFSYRTYPPQSFPLGRS